MEWYVPFDLPTRISGFSVLMVRTPEYPEKKPLGARKRTNNTQPTRDVGSENRTRATLVGAECSHPYAIPAPCMLIDL